MKEGKLILASALVLSLLGSVLAGQEKKTGLNPAPASTAPRAEKTTTGSPHEGIKVHGHWTIDVRTQEGKLVSRTEFENSLYGRAGEFLGKILGRQYSVGDWGVVLGSGDPPCFVQGQAGVCLIGEPVAVATAQSKNLTVTAAGTLVLAGSVTAQRAGSIAYVATQLGLFPPTVAPATPTGQATAASMTMANLPSTIAVQSGQVVSVRVEISFS